MSLAKKIQRRVARIEECRRQIALIETELAAAEKVLQMTLSIADPVVLAGREPSGAK
jgi:hypothetical protein